jgi:membrane associated rhomboid family serine protease
VSRQAEGYDIAVPLLVLILLFIFCISYAFPQYQSFWDANFMASRKGFHDFRYWTVITSIFYHKTMGHLMITTALLLTFGMVLENMIGSKWFMEFFLISGTFAAFNHCMISQMLKKPESVMYGSTASLTGVLVLLSLIFRNRPVRILRYFNLEPSWFALLFVAVDGVAIYNHNSASEPLILGYGAHIVAALTAIVYYHYVFRMRVWRRLQVVGHGQPLQPVRVTNMGWIIPCKDSEMHDDLANWFQNMFGMAIADQGEPKTDTKVSRFTRLKTPIGSLNLIEHAGIGSEIMYNNPMLSITVDNLANAVKNLDSRNVKMVAPVYHTGGNWAIVYYKAPDERVYEIKGPSPTQV